jgi:hypothetical protein
MPDAVAQPANEHRSYTTLWDTTGGLSQERRAREADRLKTIRLRVMIGRELDDRGVMDPAAIGTALGMPVVEAVKLLTRHQWREGDVALLEAAAARLGVQVPEQGRPRGDNPSRA